MTGPTTPIEHLCFPDEDSSYRAARNALLENERALRQQLERVSVMRRALPPGGRVPEDYVFEGLDSDGVPQPMKLSQIFTEGQDSLALYSFMYCPERKQPCPGCTHMLDSWDGMVRHSARRVALFIVAKSPPARLLALARNRGWKHLTFLSTAGNNYDRDYFGDSSNLTSAMRRQQDFAEGEEWDMPMLNVFRRDNGAIRHSWASEVLYVPPEPGQQYRHNDLLDPLWNLLDLTPEGRDDFEPRLKD